MTPLADLQYVPPLVLNPLTLRLTTSSTFIIFQRLGTVISLLPPLLYLVAFRSSPIAPTLQRLLYLLSAELFIGSASARVNVALPLRLISPISFSLFRLTLSWRMVFLASTAVDKVVASATAAYWGASLFGFLLPVALVRYFRAHFYAVEASEVKLRN